MPCVKYDLTGTLSCMPMYHNRLTSELAIIDLVYVRPASGDVDSDKATTTTANEFDGIFIDRPSLYDDALLLYDCYSLDDDGRSAGVHSNDGLD